MFIQTEATSDPAVVRFLPGRAVAGSRRVAFADAASAEGSPLAERLFAIDGVTRVALGADDVTLTQADGADWAALRTEVLRALMEHFTAGEPVFAPGADDGGEGGGDEITAQIR